MDELILTSQGITDQFPQPLELKVVRVGPPVTITPRPIIINIPQIQTATLSNFLRIGRLYHPLCRHAFVERVQIGYYYYERREEWRTCALAAAYAGAFGPQAIERPDFSYSMAIWRLSQRVGFDISTTMVQGPTGRFQPLDKEMIDLIDINFWTREGVAELLENKGL